MSTDLFSTQQEEPEMPQSVGTAADEALRSQADEEPPDGPEDDGHDDLMDRLDEPLPTSIRFESEGDAFIGNYVRLEKGMTVYGEQWIMVMADANGELHSLWLLHATLLSKLKRLKPTPGDRIGIKYLGKRQSGSDKTRKYADYKVVSSAEQAGRFSWDDVVGPDDDLDDNNFSEPPPF